MSSKDLWASGDAYDGYVGKWSRRVAIEFLRWIDVPVSCRWLDVGCGTGALIGTILGESSPSFVKGIDKSQNYIDHAKRNIHDRRVKFDIGSAEEIPEEGRTYDAAVSGLVLNFVPHPDRMISEMVRVVKSGGTVALFVWDYAGEMQMIRYFWNAAVELNAEVSRLDEGKQFKVCNPEKLKELFGDAGLNNSEVRAIDVQTNFSDFNEYWSPFLGGQGPAPSYVMSLNEKKRAELRERIRSNIPIASDGSILLIARAIAIKSIVE
jgi:SAM-dependent methyltransferase